MMILDWFKKAGGSVDDSTHKTLNTPRLRKDIAEKMANWDERSNFTLAGVKNLSRSDLNTLLMCCDFHDKYGDMGGIAYLSKEIMAVLEKYSV